MPNPGFIRGTHHLTFCVGGAQEDYDFHVRLLGLRSVKKTVLFDGEIPIYHLYYGNGAGDPSTLLTAFPYRQAGWMGKRGTNQAKILLLSIPADSIGYWSDRFNEHGVEHERIERFATERLLSATRAASSTPWSAIPTRTRASPTTRTSPPSTPSAAPSGPRPRCASRARWTTSSSRA